MPEVIKKSAVTKILWFYFPNVSLLDRSQTLLRIIFWKGLKIYLRVNALFANFTNPEKTKIVVNLSDIFREIDL